MLGHTAATLIAAATKDPNTQGLADWLQKIFGPLFLTVVGVAAVFFLFTREITRFVQFLIVAISVAVIFYYPGIIQNVAYGIAAALGVSSS